MRVGLALVVAALSAGVVAAPAAAAVPCEPWTVRTVTDGLGSLENLEPDGSGGLLVSASGPRAVLRLSPDGAATTLVDGLDAPGGLRVRDGSLYVNSGDSAQAGLLNQATGTIERVDLATGARERWASGLTMPNGLAFLPDGSALVSRDIGSETGITRIPAAPPRAAQPNWAALPDTNGLELDPTGTWLYTVETFTAESSVRRIRVSDPRQVEVIARLGVPGLPKGLDDLDVDGSGLLYVAANLAGEIIRVDPRDGTSCVLASGLTNVSAVKFGRGPGWPADHLFTVGFDGAVRELTPPAGITVVPPATATPTSGAPAPAARACRPRLRLPRAARRLRGFRLVVGSRRRRFSGRIPTVVRVHVPRGRTVRPEVTGRDRRGRLQTVRLRRLRCPAR